MSEQLYDKYIKCYELDTRPCGGTEVLYFHPGLNEKDEPLVWTRYDVGTKTLVTRTYEPLPLAVSGVAYDGKGRPPRPTLTVLDLTGNIGALLKSCGELNDAVVTIRQTWGKFLDAVNFSDGLNPLAIPNMELPKERFLVERKQEEISGRHVILELAAMSDVSNVMIPGLTFQDTLCDHEYRGELCKYSGAAMFTYTGAPTTDPTKDICGRRVADCELRHGVGAVLPCGIYCGVQLITLGAI